MLSPTNWVTALFVSPTNIEITWSLLDISLSLIVITDWSSSAASTAASSLIWSSATSTMCQECQKYLGHHLQSCYYWSSICGFVSPSKIQCIQASITLRASVLTQIYDQVIWQAHLVWQHSWQRLTALKTFCLQTATLLSVLAIGLKNIWRLTGTSTSCSWLSMSVILCVVGYDSRSKSIMVMSLHINLHALFMIWVFPSLCSRLAGCSRKMLLVPSLRQSTSSLLWCVVKYKVSWYFSLSFSHFLE